MSGERTAGLRCCLLSGGVSRRMGRDKALLPHPQSGTWFEHALRQLALLQAPITVLSRHPVHLELAQAFAVQAGISMDTVAEPPPWEGPLLALHRLAEREPTAPLLIAPVDMPALDHDCLELLLTAAATQPELIQVAHDGERLQPLLVLLPAGEPWRQKLAAAIGLGERRWQRWLLAQPNRIVPLPPQVVRNINTPQELADAGYATLVP